MKSKRKILISTLAVVLTAALAVGVFFLTKAVTRPMSAEEYMLQGTQERIEYAQSRYKEFSSNPNKTYNVLVSLDSVTTEEFTQLFAGCSGFTQVYDCITEGVDDPMYGGYLDCEGKTAAQLAAECYADTYDSICSELNSYDQQVAEIRDYYNQDLADDVSEGTSSGEDDSSKVIDTSPVDASGLSFIDGQIDPALEEDLSDLQEFRSNFISLKTAMEQGRYRIYGVKLTLTGAQAQALLQSNKVRLVEKLTNLPESIISPLEPGVTYED